VKNEAKKSEGFTLYGLSKAGLHAYTARAAIQYKNNNIKISAITPGFIDTAMTSGMGASLKPE